MEMQKLFEKAKEIIGNNITEDIDELSVVLLLASVMLATAHDNFCSEEFVSLYEILCKRINVQKININ